MTRRPVSGSIEGMHNTTESTHTQNHRPTFGRPLAWLTVVSTLVAGATIANWAHSAGAAGGDDSAFVPVTPCRVFDTRPGDHNVGPRSSPIGPNDTFVMKVTGAEGGCDIPESATAIALNATAVGPTARSYATFFPAGGTRPLASNLNYVAGPSATPNKVDVALSPDGRLAVYNAFGHVHMVADVAGYYRDDRFVAFDAAIAHLDADLDALGDEVGAAATAADELQQEVDVLDASQTRNFFAHSADIHELSGSWTEVLRVETPVVGSGVAIANYSAVVREDDAGGAIFCAVLINQIDLEQWSQVFASGGFPGNVATLSGTRRFSFATPGPHTIRVMCMAPNGDGQAAIVTLSVDYRPDAE